MSKMLSDYMASKYSLLLPLSEAWFRNPAKPANDVMHSDADLTDTIPRYYADNFQVRALATIKWLWNRSTRLEKENEELRRLAYHDALTGLFNRAAFNKELNKICQDNISKSERRQQKGNTLLMIDLDRFKAINDTHGHDVGDEVLCKVAGALKGVVRKSDMVARIGGDEFVVVCRGTSIESVQPVVDHIKWVLDTLSIEKDGIEIPIRGSVGSCKIDATRTPEQILKQADVAMYEVKHARKASNYETAPAPQAA